MARKERVLARLEAAEEHMRRAMETGSGSSLTAAGRELAAASALCRQGLSEDSYTAYGEIYDGLALAIGQMEENAADRQEEAMLLCGELLEHLARETRKEKRFKKDIVFLPYKSSMWDSLESVWKAADEDRERCNAYVIPIPYADRNPDGSIADWQCERSQFPSYVPTLDWQEVDLREWHPDVIFIHNPYDNQNRVTSVEQRFYSGNLKECTDKLVYIPYFVLEEPHPGNEAEEEAISHFVLTPGVLNADQVIVQSEAMREVYINVLSKGTNQQDRSFWEERISGAGSPKIDKVLTSRKEDFYLPERWRRLVEGKKVILYNTSVSAMLEHSDRVCDKLCYVFDVFRNRDDVALWWRPHPLMKSTIHSMRPEIEERYCEIERKYIEEGWGIYDDSPDLHRAIAWSDAYYGDGSSVVNLYRVTGKTVMIQIMHLGMLQRTISITDVQEYKGKLFFAAWNVNGIFSYDVHTGTLTRLAEFPEYPVFPSQLTSGLFKRVEKIGTRLYFIPYKAKNIYSYDLEKTTLKKYELNGILEDCDCVSKSYERAILDGDDVWLIPSRGVSIVRFCSQHENAIDYTEWYENLQNEELKNIAIPSFVVGFLNNDTLWLLVKNTNILCQFDTKTGVACTYHVGDSSYVSVAYDGEKVWLLTTSGDLCSWDKVRNEVMRLKDVLRINDNSGYVLIYRKKKVYAFSYTSAKYAIVDVESKSVRIVDNYLKNHWISCAEITYRQDEIYILPAMGDVIVKIGEDDLHPTLLPINLEGSFVEYYQKNSANTLVMEESRISDIGFLLKTLNHRQRADCSPQECATVHIGDEIYQCVN